MVNILRLILLLSLFTSTSHAAGFLESLNKLITPSKEKDYSNANTETKSTSWLIPIEAEVAKKYSKKSRGMTFSSIPGQRINAIRDGEVTFTGNQMKSLGGVVIIKHSLGFYSTYTQMKNIEVSLGEKVTTGQLIGLTSNKPFYFEMKKFDQHIDPMAYIKRVGTGQLVAHSSKAPFIVSGMKNSQAHKGLKRLLKTYNAANDYGCFAIKPNNKYAPKSEKSKFWGPNAAGNFNVRGYIVEKCISNKSFSKSQELSRIDDIARVLFTTTRFSSEKLDNNNFAGERIFLTLNTRLRKQVNQILLDKNLSGKEKIEKIAEKFVPFQSGLKPYFQNNLAVFDQANCKAHRDGFYGCAKYPYGNHANVEFRNGKAYTGFISYGKYISYSDNYDKNPTLRSRIEEMVNLAENWVRTIDNNPGEIYKSVPSNIKNSNFNVVEETKTQEVVPKQDFKPKKDVKFVLFNDSNINTTSSTVHISGYIDNGDAYKYILIGDDYIELGKNKSFSKDVYISLGESRVTLSTDDGKYSKSIKINRSREVVASSDKKLIPPSKTFKENKNAIALIIGIDKYETIDSAIWAESDANIFYDFAQRTLGISADRIKLITGKKSDLRGVWKAIDQWLPAYVEKNQTEVFLYFAGHGLASKDGNDLYLIPWDGDPGLLKRTALKRSELIASINKLKPRKVTMFMDTCYSGQSKGGKRTLVADSRGLRIVKKNQDLPSNFTLISAAANDETAHSHPTQKNGLFSYWLMRGMTGEADSDDDDEITNGELHSFVQSKVQQTAVSSGNKQTPQIFGNKDEVLASW